MNPRPESRPGEVLHREDQDAHQRALDAHADEQAVQPDPQAVQPFREIGMIKRDRPGVRGCHSKTGRWIINVPPGLRMRLISAKYRSAYSSKSKCWKTCVEKTAVMESVLAWKAGAIDDLEFHILCGHPLAGIGDHVLRDVHRDHVPEGSAPVAWSCDPRRTRSQGRHPCRARRISIPFRRQPNPPCRVHRIQHPSREHCHPFVFPARLRRRRGGSCFPHSFHSMLDLGSLL